METAAAYVRVSTERQDEYSLDSQLKLIREYAAAHDMEVPQEFVFVEDGVSGRSAKKRPAFQKMIALAKDKAHPFDCILVWKYSRFARNQEESIVYKSMLSKLGVDVVSISEPLDDSPFGSLIERIIEWMDEFYSIRLAGEVKRGMAEKVSRADYEHLIAVEELKLRRVLDAYEAGIDTMEEYARKKARLTAGIEDLRAQQSAAEAAATAAQISPSDMRRKVRDVLAVLHDPAQTEASKNASLRGILSHIVYEKPTNTLHLFFAF